MKNIYSFIACCLVSVVLLHYRTQHSDLRSDIPLKVTTWDAFGYYMYLPSLFIYQDMTGLALVDVFNHTGFTDIENATFTFVGVDGYEKSVNYTEIVDGYLVEDEMKSYFLNLTGQYRVKNIIRIIVEY